MSRESVVPMAASKKAPRRRKPPSVSGLVSAADAHFVYELAHERDYYCELYDRAPAAYLVLDHVGTIVEINVAGVELLGRSRQVLQNRPLVGLIARQSQRSFLSHLSTCRRNTEAVATEIFFKHPSGNDLPVLMTSSMLGNQAGMIRMTLVGLAQQRRLEETLQRAQRLASLGTLMAGAAHEINNPLNSILLSAQVLEQARGEEDEAVRGEMVRAIRDEAQRCAKVVRNMLRVARQEETEKGVVDLNEVVRMAARLVASYHPACTINVRLEPSALWIKANPMELEQVVCNLVKNAAEASEGPCRIVLVTLAAGEKQFLQVQDNGPGIREEHVPHIFDPFFSTKRSHGGTGLGLSVVHSIVQAHQGKISVQSSSSAGTCFQIELPVARKVPDVANFNCG